jgi:DNA-binding MarR family transcriptional regulator
MSAYTFNRFVGGVVLFVQQVDDELLLSKCREFAVDCPAFHLRKAARAITRRFDDMLQPIGIRATQLHILVAISLAGPPTITSVAGDLVMDRTTLTRNIRPLGTQGLIRVLPGEDRRTRVLALTLQGKQVMASGLHIMWEARDGIVAAAGHKAVSDLHRNLSVVMSVAVPGNR